MARSEWSNGGSDRMLSRRWKCSRGTCPATEVQKKETRSIRMGMIISPSTRRLSTSRHVEGLRTRPQIFDGSRNSGTHPGREPCIYGRLIGWDSVKHSLMRFPDGCWSIKRPAAESTHHHIRQWPLKVSNSLTFITSITGILLIWFVVSDSDSDV